MRAAAAIERLAHHSIVLEFNLPNYLPLSPCAFAERTYCIGIPVKQRLSIFLAASGELMTPFQRKALKPDKKSPRPLSMCSRQ